MCVTGNRYIDTTLAVGATIVATVMLPQGAPIWQYMLIGAAGGAASSAAQGRDPLTGAIIGGIMGGVTYGMAPGSGEVLAEGAKEGLSYTVGQAVTQTVNVTATPAMTNFLGQVAMGQAAAGAFGLMIPGAPSAIGHTPLGQVTQLQNMNTNIATTGSGGRQATKSLAQAIARTKKRKLTQDDVGDLSLSTESFTNTGLQLA